jgi:hypothetical protein
VHFIERVYRVLSRQTGVQRNKIKQLRPWLEPILSTKSSPELVRE